MVAERWCVDVRTAQRWLARQGQHTPPPGAVDSDDAMLAWVASLPSAIQAKLSSRFRARIASLRIQRERHGGPPPTLPAGAAGATPSSLDPDYAEFLAKHGESPARDSSLLADLKLQAAFAVFKLQRAQARGDLGAVKDATETLRYISGVIHDEELRAQKLGREIGDILPRAEAERILRALPYWLLRSVDELLADVCKRLAAASASGPLFIEEIRQLLEPALLSHRVLAPFARAAQINAGTTLPRWAVDAMRESLAATLEDGAAAFAQLYASPVPAPVAQETGNNSTTQKTS